MNNNTTDPNNNIPERMSNFVDRIEQMKDIANNIDKIGITVLNGIAGSGKSALANEFAHQLMEKSENSLCVRWFRSQTLTEDYISFAKTIILNESEDHIDDGSDTIKRVNNKIIANNDLKLLLVFDDVADFVSIKEYVEDLISINRVKIIITSRNNMFSESLSTIELKPFKKYGERVSIQRQDTLFQNLGPKEIEILTFFDSLNTTSISLCIFKHIIEGFDNGNEITLLRKQGLVNNYYKTEIKEAIVMDAYAFNAFNSFRERSARIKHKSNWLNAIIGENILINKKLALYHDSQTNYYNEAKHFYLKVYELNKKLDERSLETAESLINLGLIYSKNEKQYGALSNFLKAYQMRKHLPNKSKTEKVILAKYANNVAQVYKHLGDLENAKKYYLEVANLEIRSFATAECWHGLGVICLQQLEEYCRKFSEFHDRIRHLEHANNDPDPSVFFFKAYTMRKSLLKKDEDDFDLAQYANDLGECYVRLAHLVNYSDMDNGRRYLLEACKMRKRLSSKLIYDSLIAKYSYELGVSHLELGNFEEARDYFLEAYNIRKLETVDIYQAFGDSLFAKNLFHLAVCYEKLNDLENAKKFYLKVDKIGMISLESADSLSFLGVICSKQGDEKKANEYLLKAFEMRRKFLKANDDFTSAQYSYNLAVSFKRLGNIKKAREYHLISYKMRKHLHANEDNQETLESLKKLASLLRIPGSFVQSFRYTLKALEMKSHLN